MGLLIPYIRHLPFGAVQSKVVVTALLSEKCPPHRDPTLPRPFCSPLLVEPTMTGEQALPARPLSISHQFQEPEA